MALLISVCGFVIAMVLSEIALGRRKLQAGFFRILVVHAVICFLVLSVLMIRGGTGCIGSLIFLTGAFLSWFGVRSHIESSILLRMIHLLRTGGTTETGLLSSYEACYRKDLRLEELFRAGLLEKDADHVAVTAKGRWILRIVSFLR